jgi:TonB family protein
MKDAVNTILMERQALERGFSGSLLLSGFGHAFLLAAIIIASLIPPPVPPIDVFNATMIALPRGGRGVPDPAPPKAAEPPKVEPKAEPAVAPPPQKILKPPTKAEPTRALPDPNAKKTKAIEKPPERVIEPPDAGVMRPGPSATSATRGLDLSLPPGVGSPTGTSVGGDYYLASVQAAIWRIWMQQIRGEQNQTVSVSFTILSDGSVTNVQITTSSGVSLLDLAAQRAVTIAGPFRPLPKTYGTDRITVQANFKPSP